MVGMDGSTSDSRGGPSPGWAAGVPIGVGVSVGPHEEPPGQLADLMARARVGPATAAEVARGRAAWLVEVLDGAGVVVGAYDRHVVAQLSADDAAITQVVAGWVARAYASPRPERAGR